MATGQIRMTPEQLKGSADSLKGHIQEHVTAFEKIGKLIQSLNEQWEGAAVAGFQDAYVTAKKNMDAFQAEANVLEQKMREAARILYETDQELANQLRKR